MKAETDVETLAAAHPGAVVVDVREPGEYVRGHVPGAVNIPLSQVGGRLGEVPQGAVFVVCASGNRSKAATSLLRRAGRDAASVAGGTVGWQRSGRPLTTGARP